MKHIITYFLATPIASILLLMLCVALVSAMGAITLQEACFAESLICVGAYLLGQHMQRREDDAQRAQHAQNITYLDDYRQHKGDNEL